MSIPEYWHWKKQETEHHPSQKDPSCCPFIDTPTSLSFRSPPLITAAAKSLQSCPALCDPIRQPTGSAVPGILQARTLEWVAISFSNAWKWKVKMKSLSRVRLFTTTWTAAYQAPPSMGFSRQEYWSGLPLPSPYSWQLLIFSPSLKFCYFKNFIYVILKFYM